MRPGTLDRIDPEKRATLRRLAAGAAFAAPVVLSFSLGSLSNSDARAYVHPSNDAVPSPRTPPSSEDGTMVDRRPDGPRTPPTTGLERRRR